MTDQQFDAFEEYMKKIYNTDPSLTDAQKEIQNLGRESFKVLMTDPNLQDPTRWSSSGDLRQHFINFSNALESTVEFSKNGIWWLQQRPLFNNKIAWTTIDIKTIERISQILTKNNINTIIDPMAGKGFVSFLFQTCNSNMCVLASDISNSSSNTFLPIAQQDALTIDFEAPEYSANCCLLLSWVDYGSSLGTNLIQKFKGEFIIYIGETGDGCCGDGSDFEYLTENWNGTKFKIPTFFGIHDKCYLFSRQKLSS